MYLVTRRRKKRLQNLLVGLACDGAGNGDVNDAIWTLAKALKLPEPVWSDADERYVFPFEEGVVINGSEVLWTFEPDWCLHPGATIADGIREKDWSLTHAAEKLGWSDGTLLRVLNGTMAISEPMAAKLAEVLGGSQLFWTNLEHNFREGLRKGKTWTHHP